tara:strand:- start:110 stop:403 length:294 start_codon:yes stop_codon:yes gene_type:complete
MKLNSVQIKKLKSLAHHLKPAVNIGKEGVNDGVLNSISEVLEKNELIKVKFSKNKDLKDSLSSQITKSTNSLKVTIIGNTLILYKESSNLKYRHIKI